MQDVNDKELTSTLVYELLKEKRTERRWKNVRFIFWFALFAYTIFGIFKFFGATPVTTGTTKYVALIRLNGLIAPGREASAEEIIPNIKEALADKNSLGLIIDINSPGGTPVQASMIHDAILTYKKRYKKRVVIVGEDILTSGAYFVSVAADEIYVNPNTLTGSIGVIMKGFGFVDLMKKIGVERRVYIAGNQKDRLDPFLPQTPEDLKKINDVIDEVHQNFNQAVLAGRKGKLRGDPNVLFSGDFWSGQTALQLGLVDGLGNLMEVTQKEFKTNQVHELGGSPSFLKMLTGPFNSTFDGKFYLSS